MPTGVYKHKKHQGFQKGHKDFRTKEGLKSMSKKIQKRKKGIKTLVPQLKKYQFNKGNKPWNKNTKGLYGGWTFNHSDETKMLMSELKTLNKHWNWKGGVSFEPYHFDFNKMLKQKIRNRDNYKCQLCGKLEKEEKTNLTIHHIDYDKQNCSQRNLITTCRSCNSKVNYDREYWTTYFKNKIDGKNKDIIEKYGSHKKTS